MNKTAHILEICLNPSLGGLELYFSWCCEYFQRSSQKVTCMTLADSRLQKRLKSVGIEPVLVDTTKMFWRWQAAWQIARLCDETKIDLVHVHYVKDLPTVALAKMLSRRTWKLVHTRQMEMPGSKKDLYHRWVYSKVDHIFCITEKLTRDVCERVPLAPDKITHLYYGVPTPAKNEGRVQEFLKHYPSHCLKVAMFSRLERSKGHLRMLNALAMLREKGLEFQLYFFGHFMGGDGYEEELRQRISELRLEPFVYFCGFQDKPGELMSGFDVIVLPSDQETFGLVLIEAMAAGVAIMGSNTGGVPEIIEDGVNGFTFAPDDIEGLSQKLQRLLTDQTLREKMIAVGLKKHGEKFTYDRHFGELEAFFTQKIGPSI